MPTRSAGSESRPKAPAQRQRHPARAKRLPPREREARSRAGNVHRAGGLLGSGPQGAPRGRDTGEPQPTLSGEQAQRQQGRPRSVVSGLRPSGPSLAGQTQAGPTWNLGNFSRTTSRSRKETLQTSPRKQTGQKDPRTTATGVSDMNYDEHVREHREVAGSTDRTPPRCLYGRQTPQIPGPAALSEEKREGFSSSSRKHTGGHMRCGRRAVGGASGGDTAQP